jgi:rRNA-processing protein FCF1
MKEKVIFDTSFLYNKSASSFFRNKKELEQFEKVADIIIPEIVFEELEHKYSRSFSEEKEKFFKTILPNIIEHNIKEVVVENRIQEIIDKETIAYQIIKLTNFSVLPEIKQLALKKLPPFESNNGTDKGFKDTYIYFTILEYLKNVPDKKDVFVCVKDKRFKEAFENHPDIYAIESFQEFLDFRLSQFQDSYFLGKIEEEISIKIKKDQVKNFWYNIMDNKNVRIEIENEEYILEVDSDEIVNTSKTELYLPNIEQLVLSSNFSTTVNTVKQLMPYVNYFSNEEIFNILAASFSNEKIKWIIEDEDVKEFIGTLYKAKMCRHINDINNVIKHVCQWYIVDDFLNISS